MAFYAIESVLCALPAFVLLAAAVHILYVYFNTVPLASLAIVILTPFAVQPSMLGGGCLAWLIGIVVLVGLVCGPLLSSLYAANRFQRLDDENRLALEVFVQAGLIGALSAKFGSDTRLLPRLQENLVQGLSNIQQGAMFSAIGCALVLIPLLWMLRADRLLILAEAPEIGSRLSLKRPVVGLMVGIICGVGLAFGGVGIAFDAGFNTFGVAGTFLFALAVALVIRPGNLIGLIVASFGLLLIRALISFWLGGQFDEIISAAVLMLVCLIVLRRKAMGLA